MLQYISLPYIILGSVSIFLLYLKKKESMFLSNNFLIGIVATFILVVRIGEYAIAFYSGYLFESVEFERAIYGHWFTAKIILGTLAILLPILNYKAKLRSNTLLQHAIFTIYLGLIIVNNVAGEGGLVASGWNSKILQPPGIASHAIMVIIGLSLNYFMVKLKLLPEFKEIDQ